MLTCVHALGKLLIPKTTLHVVVCCASNLDGKFVRALQVISLSFGSTIATYEYNITVTFTATASPTTAAASEQRNTKQKRDRKK